MAGGRNYDAQKLKQLVLFIAEQCEADRTFGSVKLNKILWNADFAAYRELGQSITGARYQHQPEGPVLLPMLPVVRELEAQGAARQIQGSEGPRHRRLIALTQPDLTDFTP